MKIHGSFIYLIKRGNFYIHASYQKIESNIFPVFYLFHRTYTKISKIFELVHDLICKIKHIPQFCIKEKEKVTAPTVGPLGFGPSRPTR